MGKLHDEAMFYHMTDDAVLGCTKNGSVLFFSDALSRKLDMDLQGTDITDLFGEELADEIHESIISGVRLVCTATVNDRDFELQVLPLGEIARIYFIDKDELDNILSVDEDDIVMWRDAVESAVSELFGLTRIYGSEALPIGSAIRKRLMLLYRDTRNISDKIKLENGRMPENRGVYNIAKICEDAARKVSSLTKTVGTTVAFDTDDMSCCECDKAQMERALVNIIACALRRCNLSRSTVFVESFERQTSVLVRIACGCRILPDVDASEDEESEDEQMKFPDMQSVIMAKSFIFANGGMFLQTVRRNEDILSVILPLAEEETETFLSDPGRDYTVEKDMTIADIADVLPEYFF